mgnify:CR=1 FL=1
MKPDDEEAAKRLSALLDLPDRQINLSAAALLVAQSWNPGLDARYPMQELAALAAGFRARIPDVLSADLVADSLTRYLAEECGFHGNTDDYYDPANSFLHEVLRRRVGLPITLSVVYMEVGRRVGLDVQGIGFPTHFVVAVTIGHETHYVDPFQKGRRLTRSDLAEQLRQTYGRAVPLRPEWLKPLSKREIIIRMVRNLKHAYARRDDPSSALTATTLLLALEPDNPEELRDHARILFRLGRWDAAYEAVAGYLGRLPERSAPSDGTLAMAEKLWGSRN